MIAGIIIGVVVSILIFGAYFIGWDNGFQDAENYYKNDPDESVKLTATKR